MVNGYVSLAKATGSTKWEAAAAAVGQLNYALTTSLYTNGPCTGNQHSIQLPPTLDSTGNLAYSESWGWTDRDENGNASSICTYHYIETLAIELTQLPGTQVCPRPGYDCDLPTHSKCVPIIQQQLAMKCKTCTSDNAPPSDPPLGDPIFPATGTMRQPVDTGMVLADVEWKLVYDTTARLAYVPAAGGASVTVTEPPSFGQYWHSNFHQKLRVDLGMAGGQLLRGDGTMVSFIGDGRGHFTPLGGHAHRLARTDSGYNFTDTNTGALETFDMSGTLLTITRPSGKTLSFSYANNGALKQVQASDGRILFFNYNSSGYVATATGPNWAKVTAAYAGGNLTQLTWADGKSAGFAYEDSAHPWAMTGKIDENGSRYATFTFAGDGDYVTSTALAGAVSQYSLSYATPPITSTTRTWDDAAYVWRENVQWLAPSGITVTDPNGQTRTMQAQVPASGMSSITSTSQSAGSGSSAAASAEQYDDNGNVTVYDDFQGSRTCYAYDASNRETTRVEGLPASASCSDMLAQGAALPAGARMITTAWHPDWKMPAVVTQPLRKTISVYNGQPDPLNNNAAASCITGAPARPDGKPTPVLCKQAVQALLANGNVDTSVAASVTTYTYDGGGRVLTSTDARNKTTTYAYYTDTGFTGTYDSNISNVVLLLHGDGASGSTSVADSSPSGQTVTAAGNASLSNAQSVFGGSSLHFDGTGDYISMPYSSDFAFGSGDFTIETFIYTVANTPNTGRVWNTNGDYYDGISLNIDASGNLSVYASTTGLSWNYSLPVVANLANGQWYHVAVVRSGGSLYAFVNGTKYTVTTALAAASLYADTAHGRVIGGQSGTDRSLNGYIDEFRITKGLARYTANFTPPAAPLPDTAATMTATGHAAGDLRSVTNAVGQATQYTLYDPAGHVRQTVDAKGVTTDTTYTPRGWVNSVTTTSGAGAVRLATYTYDNVGQLTGVSLPDGTQLTYSYDAAHRLTSVTDARGNFINYTLDNVGNRTGEQVRDASGTMQRTVSRVFDALNRVQQVTGSER